LNKFPDFAPAQKQLAELYLRGDSPAYDKAYELAVKARATLPDDADLARNLGFLSFHRRNFAYAAQLLSESARAKPLDPTSLFYLGISYSQLRQLDESRAALTESLAGGLRDPLAAEARGALAELDSKRAVSPGN
jgi:Flp pilus assembly protein TadD